MTTVKFYFAFNSPYAFLANTRIEEALADCNAALSCKPVYSPRRRGSKRLPSNKLGYMLADVKRFAEAYGLDLKPGPFVDTATACRGFFYAQRKGLGPDFRRAVFAARWLEAADISDRAVLLNAAEHCGMDSAAFLAALDEPEYAELLEKSNADAAADEVLGFPFFVVDGERFWGNDRIEWLVRYLKQPPKAA